MEDLSHSFFYHKFITKETASVRMEIRIKSDVILLMHSIFRVFFSWPCLNRSFSRRRHLTTASRVYFVFAFLFKFVNPAER